MSDGLLTTSNHLLESVIESLPDAVYVKDLEGKYILANAQTARLLGCPVEEIIGKDDAEVFSTEIARKVREHDQQVIVSGQTNAFEYQSTIGARNFHFQTTKVPYRDEAGRIKGVIGITRDITDLKKTSDELSLYTHILEERVAERTANLQEMNAEMECFTYSVSHDLRAPLRAMQGFSQILLTDYEKSLDETGRDLARRISAASQRMDRLIQDLLIFSRIARTALKLEPVSLEKLVQDLVMANQRQIQEKGATVHVKCPLPEVKAHYTALSQAVTNLLLNGLKFMPRGHRPEINIFCEERDLIVRLWLVDNGIGIAPEHHEKIFRAFERLHNGGAYEGTGIGLAIVRKTVERMRGRVGVESEVGKGSRFWIELPRCRENA